MQGARPVWGMATNSMEAQLRFREIAGTSHSELTLGTVQLGLPYGAVNDSGQPSATQAIEIVRTALESGVTTVDTARVYGDAEAVLGRALSGISQDVRIITKLNLAGIIEATPQKDALARVDASIAASCAALRRSTLDVVMLHGWEQRHAWDGAVWRRLLELQAESKIQSLGASVYHPCEAMAALRDPEIRYLQIPMNVLDWRWKEAGVDRAIAHRWDVAIYARSALLQGILAHPAERWPQIGGSIAGACVLQLASFVKKIGRESVKDLCFAYVRALPWIASVVVGCETLQQLRENLRLFSNPPLTTTQCEELESTMPRVPEDLLNPSRWNLNREVVYAS